MQNYLVWLIIGVFIIALIYAFRTLLGYIRVAKDAEEDFAFKVKEGFIESATPKDAYVRAYRRFHAPRSTAYIAAAMSAVLVLTYPAFVIMQVVFERVWFFTGRSDVFHPGYLVWQFMIFFTVIALWGGISYVTAREFHRRAPISFNKELERQLGR